MTTEAPPERKYQPVDCPSFTGCNAPLCPLADNLEHIIWYPDEAVCSSRAFRTPWIVIQRRIARRAKDITRYFDVKMLGTIQAVHASIKGINPDEHGTTENWARARGGAKPCIRDDPTTIQVVGGVQGVMSLTHS